IARMLEDPFFDPNWHFHPEYQLFVVLEGTGTRFVGDSIQRFQSGDLIFTGPNLPHLWRSDQEYYEQREGLVTRGVVIYFHEDFLGRALLEKNELFVIRQLLEKARKGMKITAGTARKVKNLMLELLQLEGFTSILQLLNILNVLANASDYHLLSSDSYCNTLKRSDTDRMNKVYDFIMANFSRKISLEEVAALAFMTPSSFSRYFRSHTNKTFSQFLSEIRIGHASKLIIEKEMNVAEAGFKSGFNTLSNFNRQFRAVHRRSPSEYRRAYLGM
ncbi:MAG: AraC family transcriptional regulator, partial [Sinomicrobium sp.]|nr:AraC family transcriptional regulator [Sinomicrobium sp.]